MFSQRQESHSLRTIRSVFGFPSRVFNIGVDMHLVTWLEDELGLFGKTCMHDFLLCAYSSLSLSLSSGCCTFVFVAMFRFVFCFLFLFTAPSFSCFRPRPRFVRCLGMCCSTSCVFMLFFLVFLREDMSSEYHVWKCILRPISSPGNRSDAVMGNEDTHHVKFFL
jgi:hypothetical protein